MRADLQPSTFAERRAHFAELLGDAVAVIPAGRETVRNADEEHEFRQDSDFFFLTGFDEPDAIALFDPSHPKERYVLFVRAKDRDQEIWTGFRAGVEGATADYGADAAYTLDALERVLDEHAAGRTALWCRLGADVFDARMLGLLKRWHGQRQRGRTLPTQLVDARPALHELRLHKTPAELERLRRACGITCEGHTEAMRFAKPGLYEFQVQAAMEYVFRVAGSPRNSFRSIVASGPNACVLHYTRNDRLIEAGDLVLVDAGAEYGYLSADVTRTFPASGTFSSVQRAVYEVVLEAQAAAIAEARPGGTTHAMGVAARTVIAAGLSDLGLLPRGPKESEAMHHYREFYMHGVGHWLGMDVHDVGSYRLDGRPRPLEPGMVVTVEPGIYVDPHRDKVSLVLREFDIDEVMDRRFRLGATEAKRLEDEENAGAERIEHEVPAEFRGIGVRIEDDVLITQDGCEVLTAGVPKSIADVERTCAEAPRLDA